MMRLDGRVLFQNNQSMVELIDRPDIMFATLTIRRSGEFICELQHAMIRKELEAGKRGTRLRLGLVQGLVGPTTRDNICILQAEFNFHFRVQLASVLYQVTDHKRHGRRDQK